MGFPSRHRVWAKWLGTVLLLGLTLSACSTFGSPKRGVQRAGEWLSADVVALVAFQDAGRSRERWKETAMGKAWGDVGVEYWRTQQLEPLVERLFEKVGAPGASQLLGLVSGDAVLAIEVPSNPQPAAGNAPAATNAAVAGDPAVYVFLDFGENAAKARPLVPSGAQGEGEGAKLGKDRKHPIQAHSRAGGGAPVFFSTWIGDTWVASSSGQGIEALLDRRAGEKTAVAALKTDERWRRVARQAPREVDAFAYADLARIYAAASARLESAARVAQTLSSVSPTVRQVLPPNVWEKAQSVLRLLGAESVDLATVSVEMRGQGFYSRASIETKAGAPGLFPPWRQGAPLETPRWVTKNVSAFSATRMLTLSETLDLIGRLAEVFGPRGGQAIESAKKAFRERTGVDLDAMLARTGSERAILISESVGIPQVVVLWESSDAAALIGDLTKCLAAVGWTSSKGSMAGYPYQAISSPGIPIGLSLAEIDGRVMFATSTDWLREFAQRREAARAPGAKNDPKFPAGPDSLLPLLEGPFGEVPRGMTVVGRSYNNPGPGLSQINAFLPLAVPMLNLQLQQSGAPAIPSWVVSALPPILPFANNAFPTVSRVEMKDNLIVSERYSAFDPLLSPLAATALVIGAKLGLRDGE